MSELERLGVNPKPNTSINGVQMTRTEYEDFQSAADPTEFVDQMTEMESYKTMDDSRKKLALEMAIEHFYTEAEEKIETDDEFKALRTRIRKGLTENRRAAGADGEAPHSPTGGSSALTGEIT